MKEMKNRKSEGAGRNCPQEKFEEKSGRRV